MKVISTLLSLSLLGSSLLAEEAKLVKIDVSSGLPEGVDFRAKPNGYEYGIKLSYFVEGSNFIRIKENSLKLDGWKLGSFPGISEDGTQLSFSVTKKGNYINKVDSTTAEGTVTIVTGGKIEKKSLTATTKEEKEVGPFKVQLKIEKDANSWGNGIIVKGPIDDIKNISAMVGGKDVKSNSSSSYNNEITYGIKNIEDNCEVTIEYYADTAEKVITFKK